MERRSRSLPAGTAVWGRKAAGTRPLGGGRYEVAFGGGEAVETGLLVGADGAWSRVRPLLAGAKPRYVGTVFVETYLFDAGQPHSASAGAVGGGSMLALAPGKGIVAHGEPGGCAAHLRPAHPGPGVGRRPLDFAGGFAALERVAEEFAGWAPELTALLTDGETAPVARVLRALPDERRWERVPGVTLLGHAAHLMPPSGEGANLAVLDAAELGEALAAHPGDVEAALAAYEARLFPRSTRAAVEAAELLDLCRGDRAPYGLIEMFTAAEG